MPSDQLAELKKWVMEFTPNDYEGEAIQWGRAVELIGKDFGVQMHEVAIMGLSPDERSLRFLAPKNLRPVGQIPLSSSNALAARTVRDKRSMAINNFYTIPHASVFEGVPISEGNRGEPIQKIMSSPIIVARKVVGVVQVSRKGKTPEESGPDFTYSELHALKVVSDTLAPCLLVCAKE
jgi:hypothetical protein